MQADQDTVLLRTPMDKNFHAKVHVSACKLYHRDGSDPLPLLPDSQVDAENWEIKAIVGHRWSQDPRKKEFRVRFMHAPHNVPACDEWFSSADLSAGKLIRTYNQLIKGGAEFVDGVLMPGVQHAARGTHGRRSV